MTREKLPQRRCAETFDVAFPATSFSRYAVTLGFYADGRIGEVFIASYQKAGTTLDSMARDAAVFISIGLQHGVPLEVLARAVTRQPDGSPDGIAGAVLDAMLARAAELGAVG